MRTILVQWLLWVLNARWLNRSPCRFGFIGNVEAFDTGYLASELRTRPDFKVSELLAEAERFRSCALPVRDGLTVIEEDGKTRPADVWDLAELREWGDPRWRR